MRSLITTLTFASAVLAYALPTFVEGLGSPSFRTLGPTRINMDDRTDTRLELAYVYATTDRGAVSASRTRRPASAPNGRRPLVL
jgi:hypothetical protein